MKLFDSHCHLDDRVFAKDRQAVLKRFQNAGGERMMVVGADYGSSQRAVALARKYPEIVASVGVHPHDAKDCTEAVLASLKQLAEEDVVRAWGEIGLDFNRMYSPRPVQERWFERQLEVARTLQLPVIFHERDSNGRFLEILTHHWGSGQRGVVHCFSGTKTELSAYLDLGLCIGVTGIVTMRDRGKTLREMLPDIPDDRILIETDAPYLTPSPYKNKTRRNEPAFVKSVLLKLAELKGVSEDMFAEVVFHNTCRLYNLEPEDLPA